MKEYLFVPVASNNGIRLSFELSGSGDDTVVLIPGLGLRGSVWEPVRELLEPKYRVLVMEPRGSGDSDTPDEAYTGDTVATDVKRVLEAAGVQTAHIVGLSMGGMIAQDFALRFPDRVSSLVLLSTYCTPDWWFKRLFDFRKDLINTVGIQEHYRIYLMILFSPFAFRNIPDQIRQIEKALADRPPDTTAYLRQIDYCLNHDTTDRLKKLNLPTLVVTGSHDFLTPVPLGRELAAAIPGARYHQVEGASHGLWLEASHELVALCDEFIQPVIDVPAQRET